VTPQDVRDVQFDRPPLGHRGYRCEEVDAFLDRAEQAVAGELAMTADDVREVRFGKPSLFGRRGYDEDQVDAFLDRLEATLRDRPPAPP